MADGGEGTLEVLGGPNRTTTVTGPLGEPVDAEWRLAGRTAVVEMARASGLALVGGAEGNDPIGASTAGTGELLAAAVDAGARRASWWAWAARPPPTAASAALRALYPLHRLAGVDMVVLCDVRTRFVDAAAVFAPQKGASAAQVELLRRRLERLADVYLADHGVDVRALEGAGAAGGLAGGLAAAGARLVGGFDAVADELDLPDLIEGADLVVTGEGFLDEQSFEGKVVGGVADLAPRGRGALRGGGGRGRARPRARGRIGARGGVAGGPRAATRGPGPTRPPASRRPSPRCSPATTDGPRGNGGASEPVGYDSAGADPAHEPLPSRGPAPMSVSVRIPTTLRPLTGGQSEVSLEGSDVRSVISNLDGAHPGFADRLLDDEGNLRRFVNVFVADDDIRFLDGLDTPVPDGAEVAIIPAVAGG